MENSSSKDKSTVYGAIGTTFSSQFSVANPYRAGTTNKVSASALQPAVTAGKRSET